jgi:hypothetical protein
LLHVEIDERAATAGLAENGAKAVEDGLFGADGVDGVELAKEGGEFQRKICAGDCCGGVAIDEGIFIPLGESGREFFGEVEILLLILLGFGFGDDGFAEEIEREGEAAGTETGDGGDGGFDVAGGDEAAGHSAGAEAGGGGNEVGGEAIGGEIVGGEGGGWREVVADNL